MEFLIITCGCMALSFYVSWITATRSPSDRIERYYMKDDKDYRRSQAYAELASRVGEDRKASGAYCP
jgi:nickel-dependent lactate racemase